MDWALIRKHCERKAKELFNDFDTKRKGILAEVAREFYPAGVAGLTKSVENLADESAYDEKNRFLTTKPMDCLRKGAAGFHGNLTSPARRWFHLRTRGGGASSIDQDRALDKLTEATEWTFSFGGVYPQLYKLYEHCLCFGFGCMLVSRDRERIVRAQTLRVGTYALDVGEDGKVCRVVRRFSWTADKIISEYGEEATPECVKNAARCGKGNMRWTIYNIVEPNLTGPLKAYDPISKELNLDDSLVYRSIYWLESPGSSDRAGILETAGFTVKPIVAPRMDYELGDVYGRGRGLDGLDLARGIQSFQYDILKLSGLRAQPPVVAASEFKDTGLRLGRGQVNYARMGEQRQAMVAPIFASPPDSSETRADRQEAEMQLADLFFNTAFATIDALKNQTGVKTATEIDALVRENMERLNPVVTNFDNELLDPLVNAIVHYTLSDEANFREGGLLADVDLASIGGETEVEYVSQIHLAARQSQMSSVSTFLQFAGGFAQAKPEALDLVDTDGTIRCYAKMLGVPTDCLAKEDDILAIRAKRQSLENAARQQQALASLGDVAKLGAIPTDEGHAGGLIAKGLGAGQ